VQACQNDRAGSLHATEVNYRLIVDTVDKMVEVLPSAPVGSKRRQGITETIKVRVVPFVVVYSACEQTRSV
jgi:mRNA-degrading endonuclease RelE of RelBE toxin-antitoxin system